MDFIQIFQVIISILLIISVLLQNRGSGVSGVFGGGGEVFRVKRGAEKVLFRATVVLSVLFIGISLLGVV